MDPFSNLVSHAEKPRGYGDSEMECEQGSDMTRPKFLSSTSGGGGG